jgi:hypothetical protein
MEISDNTLELFLHIPHLLDRIFSYLSLQDLSNISLLNSSYHKFVINQSNVHRNRQKLRIDRNLIKNYYDDVLVSVRCYRNIKLYLNFNCDQKFFKLIEKFKDVKFLEIHSGVLSTDEFCSIIENCQNIDELILDNITFEDLNLDEVKKLKSLSRLKCIQIKEIPEELVHPLLVQCSNLKRLSIKQLSRRAPIDDLLKLLSNEVQFQLEEFEISDFGYYNFDQQKLGLVSFLAKSFKTLKILEFDVWIGVSSLELVFQMPKIEKLRLYEIAHADQKIVWEKIDIPRNHMLKFLNIQDYSHNEKLLTSVLKAAPNVCVLEVYSLSHHDIGAISTHCSELKELYAYFLDIESDSIFNNNPLKNLQRCNVAVGDDLKQIIMKRSEAERSHLEKLLLAN